LTLFNSLKKRSLFLVPSPRRSGRSRGQWVKRKINFYGEGLLDFADWKPIFLTFNCVLYYITMTKYKLK